MGKTVFPGTRPKVGHVCNMSEQSRGLIWKHRPGEDLAF